MLLKLAAEKPLQTTIILHKESVKGHQLALLDTADGETSPPTVFGNSHVLMHLERLLKNVVCPLKAKTFQT